MKKIVYTSLFIIAAITSCSKLDNYAEPGLTLSGKVIDAGTKATIQTETGSNGTRVKLEETSWSDNPTPFYFYSMQDGSFNYTKLFPGTNKVSVEGAFVPLVQYDASGAITVDQRQTIGLGEGKTTTDIEFQVEPFLRVEWMSDPVYNAADSTISVQARFTRGTANPDFQSDISDVFFYLNTMPNVGNNNYDNRYSKQVTYNGTEGNDAAGQTITLTTTGKLPAKRSYWLRIGARTSYGLKQYNYTDIKTVNVP